MPARVTVPVNGESFHVVASHDRLLLMRKEGAAPLAEVRAQQYEYGKISSLALGEDGWLWIDGDETDYMALLDLNRKPPTLGRPVALPYLAYEPCSIWQHFWEECRRAQGIYSATLDRAFITGHRVTFLGQPDLVSIEMRSGKAKLLPAKAQGARIIDDVPKLNGVLLRGSSGEALFYDGVAVTTLLPGSPDRSTGSELPTWRVESTLGGKRIFLTDVGLSKSRPFLVELKAGPMLTPISIPKELANSWLSLFTLPNNPRIWGVTRHDVVAEVKGGLQTVVTVPDSSFIDGPAGVLQAPDGSIAFVVRNAITGSSTDYFLVRASQTDKCKATLNADKPILLGGE
jgi:hypothetical protein